MANESHHPKHPRRHRARPVPKWLLEQQEIDQVAQRRCLMLLSVLSGEKAVTDAIAEAQISRPLYYQLEQKALEAMIRALTPGGDSPSVTPGSTVSRVAELEAKVTQLEREKRRAERLLLLTRKTLQSGTLKQKPGRPRLRRPKRPASTSSGSDESSLLPAKPSSTPMSPSTPTKAGEDGR
jgi:hypothetical protein